MSPGFSLLLALLASGCGCVDAVLHNSCMGKREFFDYHREALGIKTLSNIFQTKNYLSSDPISRSYSWHYNGQPVVVRQYPRLAELDAIQVANWAQTLKRMETSAVVPQLYACLKDSGTMVLVTRNLGPRLIDVYAQISAALPAKRLAMYLNIAHNVITLNRGLLAYPLLRPDNLYLEGPDLERPVFGNFEKLCSPSDAGGRDSRGRPVPQRPHPECEQPNVHEASALLLIMAVLEMKLPRGSVVEMIKTMQSLSLRQQPLARQLFADRFMEKSAATEHNLRQYLNSAIRAPLDAQPDMREIRNFLKWLVNRQRRNLRLRAAMNSAGAPAAPRATS